VLAGGGVGPWGQGGSAPVANAVEGCAPVLTEGGGVYTELVRESKMEICAYGSVRGVLSNWHPYRDRRTRYP